MDNQGFYSMNMTISRLPRLILAGCAILGPFQAYGMERLSQLWSHISDQISRHATPKKMILLGAGSLSGATASYISGHPYATALCCLGVVATGGIAYIKDLYIKNFKHQLYDALHREQPLKPIARKFASKIAFDDFMNIMHPVIAQRAQKIIKELETKLYTISPRLVWQQYFEKPQSPAEDLHNIFFINKIPNNHYYQTMRSKLQRRIDELKKKALEQFDHDLHHNVCIIDALKKCFEDLYAANIDLQTAVSLIGEEALRQLVQYYTLHQSPTVKHYIELFIDNDSNPYMHDTSGKNAFDHAQENQELVEALLKTRHIDARAPTIMEAFLASHHHFQCTNNVHTQALFEWLGNPDNIPLLSMLHRERHFTQADTHALDQAPFYVFYHGHKGELRFMQDLYRHILQFEQQDAVDNFIPLRFWHDCQKTSDALNFITTKKIDKGIMDHYFQEIQQNLLSVNLSFLGNAETRGESTMFYYQNNISAAPHDPTELIKKICTYYDFNQKYLSKLLQKIDVSRGSVLQIFIPRHYVNKIVYLSRISGLLYKNNLGFEGFATVGETQCHTKITPIIDSIRAGTFIQKLNQQKYIGSHAYRIMDELQARIVLGQDVMLNHKSGVKIFRIDRMSREERQKYMKQVDEGCRLMFIDWLERILKRNSDGTCGVKQKALDLIKDTPLGKLIQNHDRVRALLKELRAEALKSTLQSSPPMSHL